MDKFIILTNQDMSDWGASNLPTKQLKCVGSDGSGIFAFDSVPNRFSSKAVYNKSQVEEMMRDSSSIYYVQGF